MKKNKGKSIDKFHTPFKGDGKFAKIFWAPTIDYITYCTGTIPVPICDSDTLMLKTVRLRQRLRTHNNFSTGIPSCEVLLNCAQLHRALVSHHPGGNAICIAALPLDMVKCLHVHPTQNHKGNGRFAGQNQIFFASYFVRRHPLPGGKLNSAVIMICGRVGIKPFGAQRTPKITSAALLAPFHEDNGSNVANVWSFVLPGTPSSTAVFPCGTKTTS